MTPADMKVALDTIWVMIAGFFVFWMNAGFGLVEAGLCRKKNTVMILSKNFVVFAVSTLAFWAFGFGLMFSDGGLVGTSGGFFLSGADNSPAMGDAYKGIFSSLNWTGVPLNAKFFFQLVFCGTAATIVSGSVNERTKYGSFIIFSFILTAIIYPDHRPLDLGRRLVWPRWASSTSLARPWSTASAVGRRWRASSRLVRASVVTARRQADARPRPSHGLRLPRRAHPLAGLVRVQPGLDDGGRRRTPSRASR